MISSAQKLACAMLKKALAATSENDHTRVTLTAALLPLRCCGGSRLQASSFKSATDTLHSRRAWLWPRAFQAGTMLSG